MYRHLFPGRCLNRPPDQQAAWPTQVRTFHGYHIPTLAESQRVPLSVLPEDRIIAQFLPDQLAVRIQLVSVVTRDVHVRRPGLLRQIQYSPEIHNPAFGVLIPNPSGLPVTVGQSERDPRTSRAALGELDENPVPSRPQGHSGRVFDRAAGRLVEDNGIVQPHPLGKRATDLQCRPGRLRRIGMSRKVSDGPLRSRAEIRKLPRDCGLRPQRAAVNGILLDAEFSGVDYRLPISRSRLRPKRLVEFLGPACLERPGAHPIWPIRADRPAPVGIVEIAEMPTGSQPAGTRFLRKTKLLHLDRHEPLKGGKSEVTPPVVHRGLKPEVPFLREWYLHGLRRRAFQIADRRGRIGCVDNHEVCGREVKIESDFRSDLRDDVVRHFVDLPGVGVPDFRTAS